MNLLKKWSVYLGANFPSISEIPDRMWNFLLSPLLGSYTGLGDHSPLSFVFYWRQFFHLLGGAFVGLLFLPLFLIPMPKLISALIPVLLVLALMGAKEFLGEAADQPGGWDFKNVVDTGVWTLGTATVTFGFALLYYK